ncbi:hypothetical protein OUZ56_011427 [Daphnia magna]|uniref:Uncharacterized protein n=1 Tax=Daphnia magna TaxID=35525 RepID=A0ABQ9Z032_9CRUS|nr:hypothetical protein OUZ56_011427 [Daphnia magna]
MEAHLSRPHSVSLELALVCSRRVAEGKSTETSEHTNENQLENAPDDLNESALGQLYRLTKLWQAQAVLSPHPIAAV